MQDRVEADTNKKNGASAAPRKVEDMIVHAWQCMEKNKRFHYEKKEEKAKRPRPRAHHLPWGAGRRT
jgi:hypothetical protein